MEKGHESVTKKRSTPKPTPGDRPACNILADQVSCDEKMHSVIKIIPVCKIPERIFTHAANAP